MTDETREILHYRRTVKRWRAEGFEEVGEGGGGLWEINRGGRWRETIKEVRIAPDGKSLFVRIAL